MSDETSQKPETKPEEGAAAETSGAPTGEPEEANAAGAAGTVGEGEEEADEGAEEAEDAASPEAIAKRVAALGEEDEAERIARAEEAKLAERRRAAGGGKKKKGGLEAAASKKLAKIGTRAVPKRTIANASDAVDPLIERTTQLSKWAKDNQKVVGGLIAAGVLALLGFGGYSWWQQKQETAASIAITSAVNDERGRIGDPAKENDDDENRPKDPRPLFKTADERREAALAKYREVESKYKGTGAAYLARLEEGSLLLDKPDVDGAIAAFEDAKSSPLAQADAEVKGRAIEGIGFAQELKARKDAANKDAHLDDALKAFRELENMDVQGFKELGMYHQARVYELKGDKDKAKELLKSLHERLAKPGENHPFPYLEQVADDRLRALDPQALPPKPSGAMGGPGGNKMSEEQIQRLIEQMKRQQAEHPAPAPAPAPAPEKK